MNEQPFPKFVPHVKRHEDMSRNGYLRVLRDASGDIIVAIVAEDGSDAHVEFCTCGNGGGRSPNTFEALAALAEAMEKDNAEDPSRNPDTRKRE